MALISTKRKWNQSALEQVGADQNLKSHRFTNQKICGTLGYKWISVVPATKVIESPAASLGDVRMSIDRPPIKAALLSDVKPLGKDGATRPKLPAPSIQETRHANNPKP